LLSYIFLVTVDGGDQNKKRFWLGKTSGGVAWFPTTIHFCGMEWWYL
jgi:hypothetical protein